MNRLGTRLDGGKGAGYALVVGALGPNLGDVHAHCSEAIEPLLLVAHSELGSQFAQLILKDDRTRELPRRVLNVAPERVPAKRLCKQVALIKRLCPGEICLLFRHAASFSTFATGSTIGSAFGSR